MPASFNFSSAQCLESLGRIEGLAADVTLPGHGEPWTGTPADAAAQARQTGPS
jgi:glyoxylase-like metal-dependent hydrolase (beta-lactamase superfamily II)